MLIPSISNETNPLQCVLLGIANQSGSTPNYEDAYDPKSRLHILKGTYPKEQDLIKQLDLMHAALEKHGVEVLRPQIVSNCNQIFSRDIAFVIEDCLFISNILPARDREIDAIQHIIDRIPNQNIRTIPEDVHVEGGDVIVHNEFVFVGFYDQPDYADYVTARTNAKALSYLSAQFPQKKIKITKFDIIIYPRPKVMTNQNNWVGQVVISNCGSPPVSPDLSPAAIAELKERLSIMNTKYTQKSFFII